MEFAMQTSGLKKHWREQVKTIIGKNVNLRQGNVAWGRLLIKEISSMSNNGIFPFTLITDNERIVVDEHHPWMVETVHE